MLLGHEDDLATHLFGLQQPLRLRRRLEGRPGEAEGLKPPAASLTVEADTVIFESAFERWINPTNQQVWQQLIGEALDDLKAVVCSEEPTWEAQ